MKKILVILIVLLVGLAACNKTEEAKNETVPMGKGMHAVTVKEITEAPGYKYLNVEENGKEFWIAISEMPIEVGEKVYYSQAMEMHQFESKTLGRTFDSIWFVSDASKTPVTGGTMKSPHGSMGKTSAKSPSSNIKVDKAKGGKTVAEIYKNKAELEGETVILRGKVTKVNNEIMGKNWVHIQDGTEFDKGFDMLITTSETFLEEQIVTVKGTVVLDKDFGYGYKYAVLLENATVVK